jgi:hypothetical protein
MSVDAAHYDGLNPESASLGPMVQYRDWRGMSILPPRDDDGNAINNAHHRPRS